MFDFRYHVASLAAVFFALVIGILVGVALASHGLGNTERKRLEEDLRRAESQADVLRAQVETATSGAAADRAFVEGTYKSVMANRLKGKKIAVLFIGSSDKAHRSAITSALADAGAGTPLRIRFVKVPVDPEVLAQKLAKKPLLANYAGPDQLQNLGHDLGQEFVAGTDTPLWSALQNVIVEEKTGPAKPPADGVVIVRTVDAADGADSSLSQGSLRRSRRCRRSCHRCRAHEGRGQRDQGVPAGRFLDRRRHRHAESGSSRSSPCSPIRC